MSDESAKLSFDLEGVIDRAWTQLNPSKDPRPLTRERLHAAIADALLREAARAAAARKDAEAKARIKH